MTTVYGPYTHGLSTASVEVDKAEGTVFLMILNGTEVTEKIALITNHKDDLRSEAITYLLDSNYPRVVDIPAIRKILYADFTDKGPERRRN